VCSISSTARKQLKTIGGMAHQPNAPKHAWWEHETDPTETAALTSAFAAAQHDQHKAGWRRNAIFAAVVIVVVVVVKLIASL
jgi:anti-sigma-K factor RskA